MIKVRAYGYGVRDGFTPFCLTSSKNSREADGSAERSVAGRVSVGRRGLPGRGHMATDRA